jgi:hypothetical protein
LIYFPVSTIDAESKIKILEITIPTNNNLSFRERDDTKNNLIEVGKDWAFYSSNLGHTEQLGRGYRHLSGAAMVDKQIGEDDCQYMQQSLCRTLIFGPRCNRHLEQRVRLYSERKDNPYTDFHEEYYVQTIKCFLMKDIVSAVEEGKALGRKVSVTALLREFYNFKDRLRVASWWVKHFLNEEYMVLKKEKSVQTKMLIMTDMPKQIISATDLLLNVSIFDRLENLYPGNLLIIKLTGTDKPFCKKTFNSKKIEGINKKGEIIKKPLIASGEGEICFHVDIIARVLLQLKEQKYFDIFGI